MKFATSMKAALLGLLIIGSANAAEAQDLRLQGMGNWVTVDWAGMPYVGHDYFNVWLDIEVPNFSYDKIVGIVYTLDGWQSVNYAYAGYDYSMGGNLELWSLDLLSIAWDDYGRTCSYIPESCNDYYPEGIEFAVFYTLPDGYTIWDNNYGQNYYMPIGSNW